MNGLDGWIDGMDWIRVRWIGGMDWMDGWIGGMDWMDGLVEWIGFLFSRFTDHFCMYAKFL